MSQGDVMDGEAEKDRLIAPLTGDGYTVVLRNLHKFLRPKTYLEVGARSGRSLELAECDTIAVDPTFTLREKFFGKKPSCLLYQIGSDQFFREQDPVSLFGRPVDLAFLDGMHLVEFLLRDFMNTERHCSRNSVIAMHDCVPADFAMTRRVEIAPKDAQSKNEPTWWLGDVWKIVPLLRKHRPDLRIYLVDAPPSGLVLVTNLDPDSTVLSDNYADLVEEAVAMGEGDLKSYVQSIKLTPSTEFKTFESISRYFYL